MQIFHIATRSDWARAQQVGEYTTSTLGRSLDDEGFIHASRQEQWPVVWSTFYREVAEPLVLLTVEVDSLGVPVIEEEVAPGQVYPHIYGPIVPAAVSQVRAITPDGSLQATT